MSFKEKIMSQMMDKQFDSMPIEEKQKMMETFMDKFFSGMTDEDRKEMMNNMMPKMMSQMMGGEGNPMMGMMKMMMGKKADKGENGTHKAPWERCMEMVDSFKETASSAKYATPELRSLFEEWREQIEQEILDSIKESKSVNVNELVEKFKLSEESMKYLLSQMARKGLINYKI